MISSSTTDFASKLPQSSSTTTREQLISETDEKQGESVGDKRTLIWHDANDIRQGGSDIAITVSQEPTGSSTITTSTTEAFINMPAEVTESNKLEFMTTPDIESDVMTTKNETEASDVVILKTETASLQVPTSSKVEFIDGEYSEEYEDEIPTEVSEDDDVDSINGETENTDDGLEGRASSSKSDYSEALDFIEANAIDDFTTEVYHEASEIASIQFENDEREKHEVHLPHTIDKDEFQPLKQAVENKSKSSENSLNKLTENPPSLDNDHELGIIGEGDRNLNIKEQIILEDSEETSLRIAASSTDDDRGIFETETTVKKGANSQGTRLGTLKGSLHHSFRTVKNDILKVHLIGKPLFLSLIVEIVN